MIEGSPRRSGSARRTNHSRERRAASRVAHGFSRAGTRIGRGFGGPFTLSFPDSPLFAKDKGCGTRAYKADKRAPKMTERATPSSEPQASACADTRTP